jgi:hypothetical protein
MIYSPKRRFEKIIEHTVYDGRRMSVPLLVDTRLGLDETSNTLLHAANIIGGNLEHLEGGLRGFLGRVATVKDDSDEQGIILEDSNGAGSLNVMPHSTRVDVSQVGSWDVPTTTLHDMIEAWAQFYNEN